MKYLHDEEPYAGFLAFKACFNTQRTFGYILTDFRNFLKSRDLTLINVRPGDLKNWSQRLTCADSTKRLYMTCLKSFYRYLVAVEYTNYNPTSVFDILAPRAPQHNPQPIPMEERQQLVSSLRNSTFKEKRISMVVLLGLQQGLRVSEMGSLEWKYIDFENETIGVLGKGNKFRRIPMSRDVRIALLVLKVSTRLRYGLFPVQHVFRPVFKSLPDKPMDGKGIQKLFYEAKMWAGLEKADFSAHAMRHTFGTVLAESGASVYAIKDLMGHTSIQTSEYYVRMPWEATRAAHEKAFPTSHRLVSKK